MRRALARFVFVTLFGTLAVLLGVVTSMTLTPPGRDLLARTVSEALDRVVVGHVDVGGISGSFLYDLTLERLVVRDTQGVLLADIPRVHLSYRLPNLIGGRYVLNAVHVDQPVFNIVKHRSGRMNYEEVLGLGQSKGPGGPSPLILFNDVRIHDGTIRIGMPWNPPDTARTAAERTEALARERARPGRQIIATTRDGLRRIIRFEDVTAFLPALRISGPDRRPFTVELDTLAARISDPQVTVTDAAGRLSFPHDSVLFAFDRIALPHTVAAGGGVATFPNGPVRFDFQLEAPQVALADLRWISPQFPAFVGHGRIRALSVSDTRTRYYLPNLALHDPTGPGRLEGSLVAIVDNARGLGVENMDLRLRDLDLAVARAYLDSLPFYGTLTGTARGSGWLVGRPLDLDVNLAYTDAQVRGTPTSTVVGHGVVIASQNPDSGLTFAGFHVDRSDVAMGTVERLAPAITLPGRLAAQGTLEGPLRDVTFTGRATHTLGGYPASSLAGRLHLDTRGDTLGLSGDLDLDALSLDALREGYPGLAAHGTLTGPVHLEGTLGDLLVDADVRGELGHVVAQGRVTLLPPLYAADSLRLRFDRLDLAEVRGTGPHTNLQGHAVVSGSIDTLRAPEGQLALALGPGRVREWRFDSLVTRVAVADSVVRLDTLALRAQGVTGSGVGTLGWAAPKTGIMQVTLVADSLVGFDSLALALSGMQRTDTAERPLTGTGTASVTLTGALDSLVAQGSATVRDFAFQQITAPELRTTFTWRGEQRPHLLASLVADTLGIGSFRFRDVGVDAAGFADSLLWRARTTFGVTDGEPAQVAAAGSWMRPNGAQTSAPAPQTVTIDTLTAHLLDERWQLVAPARVALGDSATAFSPIELVTADGSALLRVAGRMPGVAPGDLTLDARGVEVQEILALLQADTSAYAGQVGAHLHLAGTSRDPIVQGQATVSAVRVGDTRAPFVQATVDYAHRRLASTLRLWDTGLPILNAEAELPLDLGLTGVATRKLDGPISVRVRADSLDLALVEGLTPSVRNLRGVFVADARVGGTWANPRLAGAVELRRGAMTVPSLNVRFSTVRGRVALVGDSLVLDNVYLVSDGGRLDADGYVRLDSLTTPALALDFKANRFHAIDVRNFLDVTVTGEAHLRGPVFGATLTGEAEADRGVLWFADLLNKRVVDLTDPTNADLVDTVAIRQNRLGPAFQTRFLDSLRIRNFQFGVGGDFWLRSNEANIQLTGRDLRISKFRNQYQLDGTMTALRGTYDLRIGPVTRDFSVERGSVTYLGTPDLNAQLDIRARHTVRTGRNEEIPVIASITGTLVQPKLELSSGPNIQPPIPDVDLVSYLVFGIPASEAQPGQFGNLQNIASYVQTTFYNEFERSLISDLGLPLDMLEIRPALLKNSLGGSITQIAAGRQIGQRVFFTVDLGFCDLGNVSYRNLGASLEVRFSQHWRSQLSFEPNLRTQDAGCGLTGFGGYNPTPNTRYQVGFDLLWDREF